MTAAGPCGPASRRGGSRTILLLELQIFHPLPSTVGHNLYPLLFNEAGTLLTLVPALLLREVQGMVRMLPASSFWFFGMAARLTAPASTILPSSPVIWQLCRSLTKAINMAKPSDLRVRRIWATNTSAKGVSGLS